MQYQLAEPQFASPFSEVRSGTSPKKSSLRAVTPQDSGADCPTSAPESVTPAGSTSTSLRGATPNPDEQSKCLLAHVVLGCEHQSAKILFRGNLRSCGPWRGISRGQLHSQVPQTQAASAYSHLHVGGFCTVAHATLCKKHFALWRCKRLRFAMTSLDFRELQKDSLGPQAQNGVALQVPEKEV